MVSSTSLEYYAKIDRKINSLKKRLKELNRQKENIGEVLIEQFLSSGIQNMKTRDGTFYLTRQGWAKIHREGEDPTQEEKERALEAIRQVGLGHAINIHTGTLSAFCREHLDNLPEEFEGVIDFSEEVKLVLRKS